MNSWSQVLSVLTDPNTLQTILVELWQHLYLSGIAIVVAILVAVPMGIWLTKVPRLAEPFMSVMGILQTIPSLALLALMLPVFGVGDLPAIVTLFVYALLPILSSTYFGIRSLDPSVNEAARGMGMTSLQRTMRVELPLALRPIMNGIRTSTVLIIGWATLAAYIGAGGLGQLILEGFSSLSAGASRSSSASCSSASVCSSGCA